MIEVKNFKWGSYNNVQNVFYPNTINSVGGVSVEYNLINYGEKAVKKYVIYFKAINGANEPALCTIHHTAVRGVAGYDMIDSNYETGVFSSKDLWYNYAIRDVIVDHIEVTYTDGTTESCIGNYIPSDEELKQDIKRSNGMGVVIAIILVLVLFFILGLVCIS